jgi:polyhydroxyalkanoate synthesis regulator phasin
LASGPGFGYIRGREKEGEVTAMKDPTSPADDGANGSEPVGDNGSGSLAEEMLGLLGKPLDLVFLTREKIQATLDEAAERGRVTRADANDLVLELWRRGRQQTDGLLSELSDRTRRGADPSFPIVDYEELTVAQVRARLDGLSPPELRQVRDFERRHANRKSLLETLHKALD